MQRRKLDAILDAAQDFVVDQDRVSEALASVNHSMTDGVNVGDAMDAVYAGGFGSRPSNDEVNGRSHVSKRFCEPSMLAAFRLKRDDSLAADALDRASSESPVLITGKSIEIGCYELKLDRRASAIED